MIGRLDEKEVTTWTRCTSVVDPLTLQEAFRRPPRTSRTPESSRRRGRSGGGPVKSMIAQVRSYERQVQLLMVNQFTINLGFYMLMPYLAAHLSGPARPGRLALSD